MIFLYGYTFLPQPIIRCCSCNTIYYIIMYMLVAGAEVKRIGIVIILRSTAAQVHYTSKCSYAFMIIYNTI